MAKDANNILLASTTITATTSHAWHDLKWAANRQTVWVVVHISAATATGGAAWWTFAVGTSEDGATANDNLYHATEAAPLKVPTGGSLAGLKRVWNIPVSTESRYIRLVSTATPQGGNTARGVTLEAYLSAAPVARGPLAGG